MKKIIQDEAGAGMMIPMLLAFFVLFLFFGMAIDLGRIYMARTATQNRLDDALHAAVRQVDPRALAHRQVVIDAGNARQVFLAVLTAGAGDAGNAGGGNGSGYSVTQSLQVFNFEVLNQLGMMTPEQHRIDRPTVYAKVIVTVPLLIFRFLHPTIEIPVWESVGANLLQ